MGCLWTATGSRRFRPPKWWQSWWTRRPCSWGSQPPSGGQYGSGTRGHAFGRPEHGDAPRVQKGWKGITKKNWKSVKQSQHLQSPLVCFVAVCSSFTKKACRDSLLLRRALKYKSEFVMCGYDSKWLEQIIPQIIALLLLTLYKYGPLSNFGGPTILSHIDLLCWCTNTASQSCLSKTSFLAPTWSAVDDHKMWCTQKKIGRVRPPEILRVDLVSFWGM